MNKEEKNEKEIKDEENKTIKEGKEKSDKKSEDISRLEEKIDKLEKEKKKLKKENTKLKDNRDNLYNKLNRVMADFENYKKRVRKEKSDVIKSANKDLILDILPVLDNLELAVENKDQQDKEKAYEKVVEGVQMVIKQFLKVLNDYGVKTIDAVGGAFDPNFHEALMMVETEEDHEEEELVVEEFQKGYMLNDKVIRPAKVKVSKKKDKKQKEDDSDE